MEGANAGDDVRQARSAVIADQFLPVRPIAVFEDTAGKPRGVLLGMDVIRTDIPEKVRGKRGAAVSGHLSAVGGTSEEESE